ncbi:MAG: aminoacetone oxidase family FAD-binding enzyme, partial [Gemmatimonadota bacterium]
MTGTPGDGPAQGDLPRHPVVVIGAGAAGILAAIFATGGDAPVLLLERTKDGGRKILISGGGRCNVLPSKLEPERFVTDSSPHTLRNMLRSWPLEEQRKFFEEEVGVPLALEEETGKLFPVSNKARDIRDGLLTLAKARGVELRFDTVVRDLIRADDGHWRVTLDGGQALDASRVVLASGGLSVPATGSDGVGLRLARSLGHVMHETYPALTPLTADPAVHAELSGVSLDVQLESVSEGRRTTTQGGFLFTHRGYSGPSVLDISHVAVRSRSAGMHAPITACWTALDAAAWENLLTERSAAHVITILRRELPARLAGVLLEAAAIPADRTLDQLRREERRALIDVLTRCALPWTGDEGYKKAEVTGGGVALGEVNPRTFESRKHPGLYFCGEILDAFGPIGGHNFAWAWATGRGAG